MVEQPKSDRTSVTISKRVHQDFKVRAAELGVTQRVLLEHIICKWLEEEGSMPIGYHPKGSLWALEGGLDASQLA